jgi:hypothetical protein
VGEDILATRGSHEPNPPRKEVAAGRKINRFGISPLGMNLAGI